MTHTISEETKRNIRKLLDYLWESESSHWESEDCPDEHIFVIMQQIDANL